MSAKPGRPNRLATRTLFIHRSSTTKFVMVSSCSLIATAEADERGRRNQMAVISPPVIRRYILKSIMIAAAGFMTEVVGDRREPLATEMRMNQARIAASIGTLAKQNSKLIERGGIERPSARLRQYFHLGPLTDLACAC